jgi:hypothetical protein
MRRQKVFMWYFESTLSQRGFITGADHTKLVHKAHELKRTPHLHSNRKGVEGNRTNNTVLYGTGRGSS